MTISPELQVLCEAESIGIVTHSERHFSLTAKAWNELEHLSDLVPSIVQKLRSGWRAMPCCSHHPGWYRRWSGAQGTIGGNTYQLDVLDMAWARENKEEALALKWDTAPNPLHYVTF